MSKKTCYHDKCKNDCEQIQIFEHGCWMSITELTKKGLNATFYNYI